ncbi:hypothetical protein TRVL_07881 [Trypanosoma vivax]|nr:hypothetical protein TRVL_07881 [Trypanosoma vivax]
MSSLASRVNSFRLPRLRHAVGTRRSPETPLLMSRVNCHTTPTSSGAHPDGAAVSVVPPAASVSAAVTALARSTSLATANKVELEPREEGSPANTVEVDAVLEWLRAAIHTKSHFTASSGGTPSATVSPLHAQAPKTVKHSCSTRDVPPASREQFLSAVALLLERDVNIGPRLLATLQDDTRRLLLVICTAQEYFGPDVVETHLHKADADRDDLISSKNYNVWVESVVRECAAARHVVRHNDGGSTKHQFKHSKASGAVGDDFISWGLWMRIACSAALPFMAFGILDNAIFVTAGDAIDRYFAEAFHLSLMAAAALGGVISGVAGVQMHGLVERLTQRTRVAKAPHLTAAQLSSESRSNAAKVGNTTGMFFGLLVGMTPLVLFQSFSGREEGT